MPSFGFITHEILGFLVKCAVKSFSPQLWRFFDSTLLLKLLDVSCVDSVPELLLLDEFKRMHELATSSYLAFDPVNNHSGWVLALFAYHRIPAVETDLVAVAKEIHHFHIVSVWLESFVVD